MTETKKTTATVDHIEAAFAAGKDNVAAVFNSGAVLAKGLQDFNEMWLGLARASVHDGASATKAIFGCKSVPEALDVQMDLIKTNTAKLVAENRKMTDMSAKLAEAAMEPLAKRVTATVEKFAKPPVI